MKKKSFLTILLKQSLFWVLNQQMEITYLLKSKSFCNVTERNFKL
jgi:hypothetical protein